MRMRPSYSDNDQALMPGLSSAASGRTVASYALALSDICRSLADADSNPSTIQANTG